MYLIIHVLERDMVSYVTARVDKIGRTSVIQHTGVSFTRLDMPVK